MGVAKRSSTLDLRCNFQDTFQERGYSSVHWIFKMLTDACCHTHSALTSEDLPIVRCARLIDHERSESVLGSVGLRVRCRSDAAPVRGCSVVLRPVHPLHPQEICTYPISKEIEVSFSDTNLLMHEIVPLTDSFFLGHFWDVKRQRRINGEATKASQEVLQQWYAFSLCASLLGVLIQNLTGTCTGPLIQEGSLLFSIFGPQ